MYVYDKYPSVLNFWATAMKLHNNTYIPILSNATDRFCGEINISPIFFWKCHFHRSKKCQYFRNKSIFEILKIGITQNRYVVLCTNIPRTVLLSFMAVAQKLSTVGYLACWKPWFCVIRDWTFFGLFSKNMHRKLATLHFYTILFAGFYTYGPNYTK